MKNKRYRRIMLLLFVVYLLLLVWLLFFGVGRQNRMSVNMDLVEYISRNTNLHPFRTISNYFYAVTRGTLSEAIFIVNIVGNIFAFAPMGIFLPALFKGLRRFIPFTFAMLTLIVTVELVQLLSFTGSCDIDDVILNLFGAILFFCFWKVRNRKPQIERRNY